MKQYLLALLMPLLWLTAVSQEYLGPEEALRIGLENNFGILLVRNDKAIAENNASIGNAGILPRLNLTSSRIFSVNDSRQEFLTGQVNERNDARSEVFSYGAQLNWTIFDGFRMFRRYDQLKSLEKKAAMQELFAIEQTIQSIFNQYHGLVLLEKRLRLQEQSLQLSSERVRLAETRLRSGSGSRLEYLQAQVDRNNDSSIVFEIHNQIVRAKAVLNHTLGRDPQSSFTVSDTIPLSLLPSDSILIQRLYDYNTMLMLAQHDEQIALLSIREIRSRYYPELVATMAYNYLNQQSEAGFLLLNNSSGFTYGFTASWNIFNGLNNRREINNNKILAKSSQLRVAALENELKANLLTLLHQYHNKKNQIGLEQQNALAASENLKLASQRYKIGDLSGIEYREAQKNQLNAQVKLIQHILEANQLETGIRQMTGLLRFE
jgi:outer membrane protein TolC